MNYEEILEKWQFVPLLDETRYGKVGKYFSIPNSWGRGIFWLYEPNQFYNIKIHDFYFYEDKVLDLDLPEGLSINYYESISGNELAPYRKLKSNHVQTHIGGVHSFRALIHKRIPIRSIGIEIKPKFYNEYLKTRYPDEFNNLPDIYKSFNCTSNFCEMQALLRQIRDFKGEGGIAEIFYEAKVLEAISLFVRYKQKCLQKTCHKLDSTELSAINMVEMYIHDNCTGSLDQKTLTRIAGVCATKLKKNFKAVHGCTITEYIQRYRIRQAQHLLQHTELAINQVAQAVGYRSPSRFSELFKRSTGMMPKEYRRTTIP